ncbi:hypothetical protein ACWDBD_46915 [Streptomyces sp. NPDC001118]
MSGRRKTRSVDGEGVTAGVVLLGSVAAGLALVGVQVCTALRADAAPVGVSQRDALADESAGGYLADRAAPHTDRYGLRPPIR